MFSLITCLITCFLNSWSSYSQSDPILGVLLDLKCGGVASPVIQGGPIMETSCVTRAFVRLDEVHIFLQKFISL